MKARNFRAEMAAIWAPAADKTLPVVWVLTTKGKRPLFWTGEFREGPVFSTGLDSAYRWPTKQMAEDAAEALFGRTAYRVRGLHRSAFDGDPYPTPSAERT